MQRRDHLDATAIAAMVLLCALWGFSQTIVKICMAQGLPPVLQTTIRSAGAALLGCIWLVLRQGHAPLRNIFRHSEATAPSLALAAIFGIEFIMMYVGLGMTSASRAVLFLYTAPFFTALGGHLLLPAERLRAMQAVGLLLAFAGVAAAFAEGLLHGGHGDPVGDALCFGAGALWGASNVLIKGSPGLRRVDAPRLLILQLGGSVPFLLAGAALFGDLDRFPDATPLAWLGLAYQTVIVAFATYLAYFWLLLSYPASKVSGFTFLTPLFGVLSGGLVLGEPISAALIAGLAAIAVGLRLVNRPARA